MAKKAAAKSDAPKKGSQSSGSQASTSKDEQVGFHKGSLMTLSKERQELMRILGIVEQLMQMHSAALKDLGVELDGEQAQAAQPQQPVKRKPPIEDIL